MLDQRHELERQCSFLRKEYAVGNAGTEQFVAFWRRLEHRHGADRACDIVDQVAADADFQPFKILLRGHGAFGVKDLARPRA